MWEGANAKHCCMVSLTSQPCFTQISHVVLYLDVYIILYTVFSFDLGFCTCSLSLSYLLYWSVCVLKIDVMMSLHSRKGKEGIGKPGWLVIPVNQKAKAEGLV